MRKSAQSAVRRPETLNSKTLSAQSLMGAQVSSLVVECCSYLRMNCFSKEIFTRQHFLILKYSALKPKLVLTALPYLCDINYVS